jgi:hypothetical protein
LPIPLPIRGSFPAPKIISIMIKMAISSGMGDGMVVKIIGPGGVSSRKNIEKTMNRGGV